jgi:hypothetical protein
MVLYHVSDTANRESIRQHGLDWGRMGTARGIAGSDAPEHEGVFVCTNRDDAEWFVRMGRSRGRAVDVWEIDLDGGPLVRHRDGYLCYLRPIPPRRLKLVE